MNADNVREIVEWHESVGDTVILNCSLSLLRVLLAEIDRLNGPTQSECCDWCEVKGEPLARWIAPERVSAAASCSICLHCWDFMQEAYMEKMATLGDP